MAKNVVKKLQEKGADIQALVLMLNKAYADELLAWAQYSAPVGLCIGKLRSDVEAEFKKELKTAFNLPSFPLLNAASLITDIKAGYNFKEASAINQVKKLKKPALFIHGDKDTFVPFSMLDEVYNAASCEKEKLVVKGAGHAKSSSVDPDLYWGTIKNFLNKYVTNN